MSNPILRLGKPPSRDYLKVANELVRGGVGDTDALAVLLLLMSHRDGWQTSEKDVSEMFGWGRNRRRATRAFKWLMVDRRMVVREHRRDGAKGYTNREYIFHADGHRMTVEEIEKWSAPCTKTVQAPCTRKVQA